MVGLGIDNLIKNKEEFIGKRIGLITNYSGISSDLRENIELICESGLELCKIFTPEHGLYGAMDGEKVDSMRHPKYNVPIISLYGEKRAPSEEDLAGIDVLLYDIQDVGLRYYTYIYTMANCMKAADKLGIAFVVLDRPDPLGDKIEGNRIKPKYSGFVGDYELPVRYGMTPGELGLYFKDYLGIKLDYDVVKMSDYRRDMTYPETGQHWNLPSPSIHTFDTAICYNGGCFFEATNISEGRGTARPFQIYGAPFIDQDKLIKEIRNILDPSEFAVRPRAFTPFWSKHSGETCFGAEFFPVSGRGDFLPVALKLLRILYEMYPEEMQFVSYADVGRMESLTGDEMAKKYITGGISFTELWDKWEAEAESFRKIASKFHLY